MRMMRDEQETMRILRELEEGTAWEQPGDVLAVNDKEEGVSSVALLPTPDKEQGGPGEGLDAGEDASSILGCVGDMIKNNDVEDILVVVNLVGDDQVCFTTVNRNDLVIGMLETAKMNWYSTQVELQNWEDEEGGEDE